MSKQKRVECDIEMSCRQERSNGRRGVWCVDEGALEPASARR